MPNETIAVGVPTDSGTERVFIEAERLDRDRDGTLHCYDEDDVEVATFPESRYAVREENLS